MNIRRGFRRRRRSQWDVPDVLTLRAEATPRHAGFVGQYGLDPMARRARDVNRRPGLPDRHSVQSNDSVRWRAVQN
jgi:hypothetical protein